MKLFLFFLLLIPVAYAELDHINFNPDVFPGENFSITLTNSKLPSLLTIDITQPCISKRYMLMTSSPQNLSVKINASVSAGSYVCSVTISYNSTTSTTTTIRSTSSGSGGSKSTTSTVKPVTTYTIVTTIPLTTTSILNETLETSTTETTTTSVLSYQEKIKFKEYGKFYIAGIILMMALIAVIAVLRNKPKDPFKEPPPIYEPKI